MEKATKLTKVLNLVHLLCQIFETFFQPSKFNKIQEPIRISGSPMNQSVNPNTSMRRFFVHPWIINGWFTKKAANWKGKKTHFPFTNPMSFGFPGVNFPGLAVVYVGVEPKIGAKPPKSWIWIGFSHYFYHPLWGVYHPYFCMLFLFEATLTFGHQVQHLF